MASFYTWENTLLFEIKVADSKELWIITEVLPFLALIYKLGDNTKGLTDTTRAHIPHTPEPEICKNQCGV